MIRHGIALLAAALVAPTSLESGVPKQPGRPTVALALAGGSALGLAHIGVLRWLDEHQIPVDAIAGTSMGGLIGALYATGHSPQEIAEFVRDADLERLFGTTAYGELSFRRKEDRRDFPNELEIGWNHGIKLPSGLNAGQGVRTLLSRFAAPYGDVASFDALPTPFACVATDLVSGRAVVLRGGSLHDALRATMSLPGIFAPVELETMRLVDGGLVNNLPIDVARELGTDVVIAVSLDATDDRDIVDASLLGIARRSLDVMIRHNQLASLAHADRVLFPELRGFNTRDFARSKAIADRGYEEAERHAEWLLPLALPDPAWRAYRQERESRRRSLARADVITVEGAGREDTWLERDLRAFLGTTPTSRAIEAAMDRIAGLGPFATASYEGVVRDGRDTLLVSVARKSYGSPYVNLGISFDASRPRDAGFQLDGRVTFRGLGRSEWRNDFGLGNEMRAVSEYFLSLKRDGWFAAARAFAKSTREDFYEGTKRVANHDLRNLGAGVDVGRVIGRSHEIRLGFSLDRSSRGETLDAVDIPEPGGRTSQLRLRWVMEDTDAPFLPEHGARAELEARWVLDHPTARGGFASLTSHVVAASRLGRLPLLVSFRGGAMPGRATPLGTFALGGAGELSALGKGQLRGDNFGNFTLRVFRPLQRDSLGIFLRTYVAVGYEVGAAFATIHSVDAFHDGTLELIGVTRFGVLQLGAARGDAGIQRVYVRFGKPF